MRSSNYTNYSTASWWPLWRWDDQRLAYSEWAHESSPKVFRVGWNGCHRYMTRVSKGILTFPHLKVYIMGGIANTFRPV